MSTYVFEPPQASMPMLETVHGTLGTPWHAKYVSLPKIISARSDGAIRRGLVWSRWFRIAARLVPAARPCSTPNECASHCNKASTTSEPVANDVRLRSGCDPGSHGGGYRSGVQHMHFAKAISVRLVVRESPSPALDV